MMELSQLKYFYAVARVRGFSKAEKLLSVRQPAISKMVKALEERLGVVLFERHKRGVNLTPAGEAVFESCRRIFDEVDNISVLTEAADGACRGDLKLSASEHVVTYLLPPVVAALRTEHPLVVPRMFTGPSHLMVREIVDGQHELGLFFKLGPTPLVDRTPLARVPCRVVVAAKHARDDSVLRSFIGSREIDDLSNKAFPTVAMLRRKRPGTAITISCNSLEAHKALIRQGCGVSILPTFVVESELRAKELTVLHSSYEYLATLELVTKRGRRLSRSAHLFLGLLRRHLAKRFPRTRQTDS